MFCTDMRSRRDRILCRWELDYIMMYFNDIQDCMTNLIFPAQIRLKNILIFRFSIPKLIKYPWY